MNSKIDIEEIKNKIIELIQMRFHKLLFDEDVHKYTVNGKEMTSCTTFIKKYTKEFNAHMISCVKAKKTGISAEYYRKKWYYLGEEAKALGSRVHNYMEYAVEHEEPSCDYERAGKMFFNNLNETIIRKELKCFYKNLAGTMDLLTIDDEGKITIWDYKTNNDLYKYYGNKLLEPFKDMKDTPLNKYRIQLNLYKYILEKSLGITIDKMKIVWLKPNEYEIIEVENLDVINNIQ